MLGRAVVVAVDLGVFQELIGVEPAEELLAADVLVGLALLIAGLLRAGGGADDVTEIELAGQPARDGALADAGRADEHDEQAAASSELSCESVTGHVHSTFCTCSLSRSMAPLISTMWLAISASLALQAMVLASRSISWVMKSSLRPACSPLRQACSKALEVAGEPLDFLADVGALGEDGDFLEQVRLADLQLGLGEQLVDARGQPLVVVVDDERGTLLDLLQVVAR